jgi:hypothetical protein
MTYDIAPWPSRDMSRGHVLLSWQLQKLSRSRRSRHSKLLSCRLLSSPEPYRTANPSVKNVSNRAFVIAAGALLPRVQVFGCGTYHPCVASTQTSIFVPSKGNPLVDILLARGVNGESPIKKRASRKSTATPKLCTPTISKAARTKTPRAGSSKHGTHKSVAASNKKKGKENFSPAKKKRGGTLKSTKLQKSRTDDGAHIASSSSCARLAHFCAQF